MELLLRPFHHDFFTRALLVSSMVGLLCGVISGGDTGFYCPAIERSLQPYELYFSDAGCPLFAVWHLLELLLAILPVGRVWCFSLPNVVS